jgi:hypothetical protein
VEILPWVSDRRVTGIFILGIAYLVTGSHFKKISGVKSPKVGHLTREDALPHARQHQTTTNIFVDVYLCPVCSQWHVGRAKYIRKQPHSQKYEEVLAGKLIAALKLNLNKEKVKIAIAKA